ncbi:MAG TPA: SprB repeat-containing protein, partial [Tenuifilaceae bacterium]|nr:SprB repeat-containing protein [Tenuifilaceae bacterium]
GSTNTTGSNPDIPLIGDGSRDGYLAKYDTNGNLLWAYAIAQGALEDRSFGVITDSENNIYVSGFFRSTNLNIFRKDLSDSTITKTAGNNSDGYIVKYSPDAYYLWHKQFSSPTYARNTGGIALAPNNGVYVAIDFTSSVSVVGTDPLVSASAIGNKAVAIFKLSEDSNVDWVRVIRGSVAGSGVNVVQGGAFTSDAEGNLYAIGQGNTTLIFEDGAGGNLLSLTCNAYDGWLAKYSTQGVLLWAKIAGGLTNEMFNSVSYRNGVASVVGYYSAVTYLPSHTDRRDTLINSGGQDIFLINYNSDGQYLGSSRMGGSLDDEASSVAFTPDGNSIVGASFKSTTLNVPGVDTTLNNGGLRDMFLGKHINIHFLPEETPISCNNGNNGALTFTIFGGGEAPYSYSFAKVGGSVIGSGTYSNPVTFQNLDAGTYYVDITDNQTRTIRKYYKINNPTPITITGNVVNVG